MKRWISCAALVTAVALAGTALEADVKTTQKTTAKLEGMLGAFFNRMAGGKDGITSTAAIKGNRMETTTGSTGQIVDLTEEKVYRLDMKKKSYDVVTFAEMRKQLEDARAEAAKQQPKDEQAQQQQQQAAQQLEFDVKVDKTGRHQPLLGRDTEEAVLTITMHEKGKKLEDSGGMVMTTTMWLAPKIAALDEIAQFNMRYFKAVYGGLFSGVDLQQMNTLSAMLPGFGKLMDRTSAERQKLQGTPLSSTTVIEAVKSPEQMKEADSNSGGGGLTGRFASRLMHRQTEQRTKTLTLTNETLSIATTASADDVAIPAGFKEKK
jgi:hypothetical protein